MNGIEERKFAEERYCPICESLLDDGVCPFCLNGVEVEIILND